MNFEYKNLYLKDSILMDSINKEFQRQNDHIELIASENFVSKSVLEAQGSVLTNKYAEGYPSKRYYGGCSFVDEVENLAIERVKKLFGCKYANVQPHSGSQANQAAFFAFLNPGDTILSMSMDSGGHLTHGSNVNMSGKWFNVVNYGVDPKTYYIDYDNIKKLAIKNKPKMIICGFSAYPREFDFKIFREIADEVGAYLLSDISHISGLVATGYHNNPFPYSHIVTSTTHKTLRGPRGGIILSDEEEIAKKINSSLFPGIQGGPLMHVIAAKAVSFLEASMPDFKKYIQNVISNAKTLSKRLIDNGFNILTEGTDNHLVLVDLRNKNITGKAAERALELANITCNKNNIPFDTASPFVTSGIRLGSPACTTRGFSEAEFIKIADFISEIIDSNNLSEFDKQIIQKKILDQVLEICKNFKVY